MGELIHFVYFLKFDRAGNRTGDVLVYFTSELQGLLACQGCWFKDIPMMMAHILMMSYFKSQRVQ